MMKHYSKMDIIRRTETIPAEQIRLEKILIHAKNGIYVCLSQDPIQALCVGLDDKGGPLVPRGVFKRDKQSFKLSGRIERIKRIQAFPEQGIFTILFRANQHRKSKDNPNEYVDLSHYRSFIRNHSQQVIDKYIESSMYTVSTNSGVARHFYYYRDEHQQARWGAVKLNPLFEASKSKTSQDKWQVFFNRTEDKAPVDLMISMFTDFENLDTLFEAKCKRPPVMPKKAINFPIVSDPTNSVNTPLRRAKPRKPYG